MNRRKQERRQSLHTLSQIICACNEAKLMATIDAQEKRIQMAENLLAKAGDALVISGGNNQLVDEIGSYFDNFAAK